MHKVGVDISIVVPIYNEERNLDELYRRIVAVFARDLTLSYEVIFVDDGSRDTSWEIIKKYNMQDDHVKGIGFSRNFGHHLAITAGLDYAKGDHVVLMDADLQDKPEDIPKLYQKMREGYDVVYAIRTTRDDPFLKKMASNLFYRFFRIMAKVDVPANTGIFRIMNRQAADSVKRCREKARVMIALMSWAGFSHAGVETQRDARFAGETKYNLFRLLKLALDGVTSFSYVPLRIAAYLGFGISLLSFLLAIYILVKKIFFGIPILGYASIIVSILFVGGIQLLLIGIMGEYVGRIFTEVQNRPLYLVKNKIGYD